jgi:hypothetical protein
VALTAYTSILPLPLGVGLVAAPDRGPAELGECSRRRMQRKAFALGRARCAHGIGP